MPSAQARRPFGKDFSQAIHVLLQLFWFLVVEDDLSLTDSTHVFSFVEHSLERNLLISAGWSLILCRNGAGVVR